ncbi:hypothetical protein HPB48_000180 [Haemaphysalis longicornis]|uniref:Uncharacterized protein n=1 Tax=Haemaphysalis longicornis TaxID=44386 RepID=A0A9J6FYH5_HAELO|nr:hypothetical protein HPB48_000180 [Haemaphysalis longicornis]
MTKGAVILTGLSFCRQGLVREAAVGAIRKRAPPKNPHAASFFCPGPHLEPPELPVLSGLPFLTAAYTSSPPNYRSGTASRSVPRIHRAGLWSRRPRTTSISWPRDPLDALASRRRLTTPATQTSPPNLLPNKGDGSCSCLYVVDPWRPIREEVCLLATPRSASGIRCWNVCIFGHRSNGKAWPAFCLGCTAESQLPRLRSTLRGPRALELQ